MTTSSNQSAASNRRPAGQLDGSDNLAAIVAADRAFPAAVAELDRWTSSASHSVKAHISSVLLASMLSLLLTAGCSRQEPDLSAQIQGRPFAAWVAEVQSSQTIDGKNPGLDVLVLAGPRIVPQLTDILLHDPSAVQQWKAAYAIGAIAFHNPDAPEVYAAIPALTSSVQGRDPAVRVYAVQGLGAVGKAASNAIPLLIQLTSDNDTSMRMSAVDAIGRVGIATPKAVDALKLAVSDPNGTVQLFSIHALDAVGHPASNRVPVLIRLTTDEEIGVRIGSVETLGRTGTGSPECIGAIKLALSDTNVGVRLAAETALRALRSNQE